MLEVLSCGAGVVMAPRLKVVHPACWPASFSTTCKYSSVCFSPFCIVSHIRAAFRADHEVCTLPVLDSASRSWARQTHTRFARFAHIVNHAVGTCRRTAMCPLAQLLQDTATELPSQPLATACSHAAQRINSLSATCGGVADLHLALHGCCRRAPSVSSRRPAAVCTVSVSWRIFRHQAHTQLGSPF